MTKYLILDETTGEVTGRGYASPYETLGSDKIACDDDQYDAWQTLIVVDGAVQAAPASALLARAQTEQINALSAACQTAIYAGFTSSALGARYTYPAKDKDQTNLAARVTASLYPNLPADWTRFFWCADATGNWALRPHTAAQIQQVGADGDTAISAAIAKNTSLAAQVMAATTVEAVQAIVWS